MFIQQLINGITLGSVYALFALGYTLVYGILLMINFAHSEIFMVGAYCGFWILAAPYFLKIFPAFSLLIAFALATLAAGLVAVAIEKIAYRPLRHAPRLSPLIGAIGVSIFLQNLFMLSVSAQSLPYPESFWISQIRINGVVINSLQIFIFALAVSLMLLLQIFIHKTKYGKAMRATAHNHMVAQLMGVNVNSIIALTFFIGGGLGGVAGVLNGLYYGSIKYNMGFLPGIKAFTAAVVGGIGNVKGAMAGGFILGILEAFSAGYISSEYKDVITFAVLMVVLALKPSGLFGEQLPEKI
jgi:branched-chain amino acid transport system permease protein